MKKKILLLGIVVGAFTACQDNADIQVASQISEINPSNLPASSQSYIDTNFQGEIVADAFKVTGADNQVTYEAFMSNNTNLVFHEDSNLIGFGNINSRMVMNGEMHNGGMENMGVFGNSYMYNNQNTMGSGGMMGSSGMMGSGGMMGNKNYGMMGKDHQEFRNHPEITPIEIDPNELPSEISNYIHEHYGANEILMCFEVNAEGISEYHILVQNVGGMIFDNAGNFEDMIRRGMGHCEDYEEIELSEISESAVNFIKTNYAENEIIKARIGYHNGTTELQVLLADVGILVFDTDGNFIELMKKTGSHHN